MARHSSVEALMKHFTYAHLPARLQEVSRPFCELADSVADRAPNDPETTACLRKIMEAKDCAVRAALNVTPLVVTQGAAARKT